MKELNCEGTQEVIAGELHGMRPTVWMCLSMSSGSACGVAARYNYVSKGRPDLLPICITLKGFRRSSLSASGEWLEDPRVRWLLIREVSSSQFQEPCSQPLYNYYYYYSSSAASVRPPPRTPFFLCVKSPRNGTNNGQATDDWTEEPGSHWGWPSGWMVERKRTNKNSALMQVIRKDFANKLGKVSN